MVSESFSVKNNGADQIDWDGVFADEEQAAVREYEPWVPFSHALEAWPHDTLPIAKAMELDGYVGDGERKLYQHGLRVNVLRRLGYGANDDETEITNVPVPRVVAAGAKEFGVEVEFFPEGSELSGVQYLGSLKNKKWPVASGTLHHYLHDTGDVHLTTVVLGGDSLMTELAGAAEKALQTNDPEKIAMTSIIIDTFLAALRDAGETPSAHLLEYADDLGTTKENIIGIVDHIRETLAPMRLDPAVEQQRFQAFEDDSFWLDDEFDE